MKRLSIDPKTADIDEIVERAVLLHGHVGPFLVVGIRMGLLALELLEHPGYFGLSAESEAGSTPPVSCLNDGVQIGSGCTTGKGNLITNVRVFLSGMTLGAQIDDARTDSLIDPYNAQCAMISGGRSVELYILIPDLVVCYHYPFEIDGYVDIAG